MKNIILLLILAVFSAYSVNGQEAYSRPLPDDTLSSRLYLIKKARELNIDSIHAGFDSLQIRIWYDHGAVINKRLLIFKKYKGKWSADYYDMISEWNDFKKTDTLVLKSFKPVSPKSGWDTLISRLLDLKILSLPNMHDIPGLKDYWEDGSSYTVEVATTNYYRHYRYHMPAEFKNDFWQANAMIEILKLITTEFEI